MASRYIRHTRTHTRVLTHLTESGLPVRRTLLRECLSSPNLGRAVDLDELVRTDPDGLVLLAHAIASLR